MRTLNALVFAALAAAGCKTQEAQPAQAAPAQVAPAVPTTAPVAPTAPAPVAPAATAVVVPPYQWTEAPAVETIPQTPVAGLANGRSMGVAAVMFEPGATGWKLVLADTALDGPVGLVTTGQSITVELPEEPAAGKSWTRKMEAGGGSFQINNDPANPAATVTLGSENAWALEVTKWDVRPWDASGPLFQEAGRASGRIAICYKGDASGVQSSWVAGAFTDAVVRYMGKPSFAEAAPAPAAAPEPASSSGAPKAEKPKKAEKPVQEAEPTPKPQPDPPPETAKPGGGEKPKVDTEAVKKGLLEGLNRLKAKKAQEGQQ